MAFGTLREPSIAALRDAPCRFRYASNKRAILVDALTASAVVACFDALQGVENKAKFERMVAGSPQQFRRIVDFCWKHVKVGGAP
jgi:hypothetical protein